MNFGQNIKKLRISKGITGPQLAEAVGVSKPFISMIERGTKSVTLQLALDIADYLGCSINDIIGNE